MKKGKFITFYGINNIGKSTHSKLVVEKLTSMGLKAKFIKYPIYDLSPTGPKINRVLRVERSQSISEEELQTLFMKNREDFEKELRGLIDEGYVVVAEDYAGTGIAWGTAKGLDQSWVEKLNAHLLKEDFSILLVGARSFHAKEKNHLHENDDELVNKVDQILRALAKKKGWVTVQVQPDREETARLVFAEIKKFLQI